MVLHQIKIFLQSEANYQQNNKSQLCRNDERNTNHKFAVLCLMSYLEHGSKHRDGAAHRRNSQQIALRHSSLRLQTLAIVDSNFLVLYSDVYRVCIDNNHIDDKQPCCKTHIFTLPYIYII